MEKNILFEQNEKEKYLEQIKIRGSKIYNYALEFICKKRKCNDVNYEDIVALMKYDKRLKYNLYMFMLSFEEWLRSKLFEETIYKNSEFKKSINSSDTTSLDEIIKNQKKYDLNKTLLILKNLSLINDKKHTQYIQIKNLRNKIMHFALLYPIFEKIILLIKKLKESLPYSFKETFIGQINKSKKGLDMISDLLLEDI